MHIIWVWRKVQGVQNLLTPHQTRVVESRKDKFFKDVINGSDQP